MLLVVFLCSAFWASIRWPTQGVKSCSLAVGVVWDCPSGVWKSVDSRHMKECPTMKEANELWLVFWRSRIIVVWESDLISNPRSSGCCEWTLVVRWELGGWEWRICTTPAAQGCPRGRGRIVTCGWLVCGKLNEPVPGTLTMPGVKLVTGMGAAHELICVRATNDTRYWSDEMKKSHLSHSHTARTPGTDPFPISGLSAQWVST